MLCRLKVENYALIDALHIQFENHLNIITGETGAGKSILLGAMGLLLGGRSDSSAIKNREKNCIVEGTFLLKGHALETFFAQNDLEYAEETTLTRIITPSGKNRAFINDIPVTIAELRELGGRLIDIHSQHQNLILSSEEFRTTALDTVAGTLPLREEYRTHYLRLQELRKHLAELKREAEENRRNEEWLRFRGEELTAAGLKAGELQQIEEELKVLENVDKIGESLGTLCHALDNDEDGILGRLKLCENALSHVREQYPAAGEYAGRLRSVLEELKDINSSATDDAERLEGNPERLSQLSNRYDTLLMLQQKHHVDGEAQLLALRDETLRQLAAIEHSDMDITTCAAQVADEERKCEELAARLHTLREEAAPQFAQHIIATLARLGMAETLFEVRLDARELSESGADNILYLFTSNKTMKPQPVEKIASGGELSRVMLSLKAMLSRHTQLPTIIFDEIDTGVSGRIADAMGDIIAELSSTMQVIDITHLPQVASKGESHFVVYKQEGRTDIRRLNDEERIAEIAKMLSGSTITDAAMAQAHILLKK